MTFLGLERGRVAKRGGGGERWWRRQRRVGWYERGRKGRRARRHETHDDRCEREKKMPTRRGDSRDVEVHFVVVLEA